MGADPANDHTWQEEIDALRSAPPRGILFLCVANSARSQMAEAIGRSLASSGERMFSAGSAPTAVNPLAVRVMREIGLDMSDQRSKGLSEIPVDAVDLVVTLCAEEACPLFPGNVHRLHWALPDPVAVQGDDEMRLAAFRKTREELGRRIGRLLGDPRT